MEQLDECLKHFYKDKGKPAILEIKTDAVISANAYKGYFNYLRKNKLQTT